MIVAVVATTLGACAGGFDPVPMSDVPFLERGQTQAERGIQVTAAVPSASETRDLFGISLYKRRIQPVWIEISNDTDEDITFLPAGIDKDYHPPFEVAAFSKRANAREQAEKYFFENGVDLQISIGETRSGFVFTNLDEGTKAFNVDIVADSQSWQFTYFIHVPGLAVDHYDVDFKSIYAESETSHHNEPAALIEALQNLPCCTTDKGGKSLGDPLNLVMIGEPAHLYYAFIRAGWDETEVVGVASGFKTAMSFITGGEYRYSPVSSLYVFGRRQDIALQKIRSNIHERNHFRLWRAPMTFEGKSVWIGQISRDIGVRFTTKTITTHKIDPDVDETREFLLENLAYNEVLQQFAYVPGVGAAGIDSPRQNLTGDPYYTDGLRMVIWIPSEPIDIAEVVLLDWSVPDS